MDKTKTFQPSYGYIFSREKYIASEGKDDYNENKGWVDYCEGKRVNIRDLKSGLVEGLYIIRPKWCVRNGSGINRWFRPECTYVFTKKKYIKNKGRKSYAKNKIWVDKCNGQIVEPTSFRYGFTRQCGVIIEWCKCIGRVK